MKFSQGIDIEKQINQFGELFGKKLPVELSALIASREQCSVLRFREKLGEKFCKWINSNDLLRQYHNCHCTLALSDVSVT